MNPLLTSFDFGKKNLGKRGAKIVLIAFLSSFKRDVSNFLNGKSEINTDVFIHPLKYSVSLQIEKLVVDSKVSRQGIEFYKQKIASEEKIGPLIVVKHPRKELYAVLDGHHRYYAHLEMGKKEIDCALAGDYSSVIFYLTEHGWFQPIPEITEGIRHPAIKLHQNLKQFLTNFVNSLQ
jgi:hypothetical protein